MRGKKTVELRPFKERNQNKIAILNFVLAVTNLLVSLFKAIDRMWNILKHLFGF